MGWLLGILLLSVLIIFHELGHFLAAKMFGVEIQIFSLGYGKKTLWSKQIGKTKYQITPFLLGGYVKIAGFGKENEPQDKEMSFAYKSYLQKMLILLAGPAFNFLLAMILLILIFLVYGIPEYTNKIGDVPQNLPAARAGIKSEDTIIAINNIPVHNWDELYDNLRKESQKEKVDLLILRDKQPDNQPIIINVKPDIIEGQDQWGQTIKYRGVGIKIADPIFVKKPQIALQLGISETFERSLFIIKVFYKMITGQLPRNSLGGPVLMVQASQKSFNKFGLKGLLNLMSFISLNLFIFNLLPIPVLDGGHMSILTFEKITRKPINEQTKHLIYLIGLGILLGLMTFSLFNDILRLKK